MKIDLKQITVHDLVKGYEDRYEDGGVVGYGGKLNIRPPYQREFIYNDKQSEAVIRSIMKDFPLNVMYWVVNKQGTYELLDGQQRTISICEFVDGNSSVDNHLMNGLSENVQKKILDYKLMIYFCKGNDSEILDWFKVINIAGEKLTPQEQRNAVYTGPWLADAKKFFSKTGCPAHGLANEYMNAAAIRQEDLEAAIKWHAKARTDDDIRDYMGKRQQKQNANELKQYFRNIFSWVEDTFPPVSEYSREMKGVDWGVLYNHHRKDSVNTGKIAKLIEKLMRDDDVTNKRGIFAYVLNGDEKHLNIRQFTDGQKRTAYQKQKGLCKKCRKKFEMKDMEGDHIKPWSKGGKTELKNCQMLCKGCNRKKSDK